jgi:hypothetical protein
MRQLLALSAFFCSLAASESVPAPSVAVVVSGNGAPASILQSMEREAESALAPSGLKLNWMNVQDLPRAGVPGELTVLRLRGECGPGAAMRPKDLPVAANGNAVLGQTHLVDGRVLPIADVLCDAVRKLVEGDLKAAPAGSREELLGRAFGRVAAHELYHMLVHTTEHARSGLSRSEQSSRELLAPHESFSPEDEQRISDSLDSDASGR